MLILGIDPGTATTGWGLLEYSDNQFEIISWGLVETQKDDDPCLRLSSIYHQLTYLFGKYKPEVIAMEKVFFASNAKTVIRVGQAQGIVMLCA